LGRYRAQDQIGDAAGPYIRAANVAANSSVPNTGLAVPEDRWEQMLLSAEDYIASGKSIQSQTPPYKELLDDVHTFAKSLRQASLTVMGDVEALLEAHDLPVRLILKDWARNTAGVWTSRFCTGWQAFAFKRQ
jgi:hypothetical protein